MVGTLKRAALLAGLGSIALAAAPARAQTWINWTTLTGTGATGTITGLPGGSVSVTLTGGPIVGLQTGVAGETNYWSPASAWNGAGSAPTNSGFVQLSSPTTFSVTFSSPVDLYMALISVGQPSFGVTYAFDRALSIVSQGPSDAWGGCSSCLTLGAGGLSVTGNEGDGTLHFVGPVSTLTFTTTPTEFWHGFTLGAKAAVVTTPEPASMTLLATGLAGLFGAARRRRKA